MNRSVQLDERRLVLLHEMHNNLVELLKQQPDRVICMDNEDCDTAWGYVYNETNVEELQVKGVYLNSNDQLCFVMDIYECKYSHENLLDDDILESVTHVDSDGTFLYQFTLINVNEVINQYI